MPAASALPSSLRKMASAHVRGRGGAVAHWLWCVAGLVFLMVILGGATRLTESGLSITEWKPVTGVIPPLSHAAWLEAFAKYKQIPQYESLFPDMSLGHFQAIFLMEWTHRLVGRLLGFALIVPFVFFWVRGRLTHRLKWQVLGIFALGGLQGFVGWWMVSSGLVGRVEVAQERLAIHLLLASLTFAALVWLACAQKAGPCRGARAAGVAPSGDSDRRARAGADRLRRAGRRPARRAGLQHLAADGRASRPARRRARRDIAVVAQPRRQCRRGAVPAPHDRLSAAGARDRAGCAWTARVAPGTSAKRRAVALAGIVAAQATIGILTLVLVVPIWAGLLHQAFAMVVLAMSVVHRQRLAACVAAERVPDASARRVYA